MAHQPIRGEEFSHINQRINDKEEKKNDVCHGAANEGWAYVINQREKVNELRMKDRVWVREEEEEQGGEEQGGG